MKISPYFRNPLPSVERYDTHVPDPWVERNPFRSMKFQKELLPSFQQAKTSLPQPFWQSRQSVIDCYWRAWELAFSNLHQPLEENGFISNYCDTAFNGNLFMWDSCFITFYGIYGRRAFNFQQTLDNFYCKQHRDGFICREICEEDGADTFHRFDPSSAGPNIFAWTEWNHYLHTGDDHRLEMVFPVLLAFYNWMRTYRTWQDGSYFSSGWGSGMDNLPRLRGQYDLEWSHGHMSWIDTTLQAILNARLLVQMANILGQQSPISTLVDEIEHLEKLVNQCMWENDTCFYYDRFHDGTLSTVKHIGAYWAALAEILPHSKVEAFIAHLDNSEEFNRPHRIPALSADHPQYSKRGNVWSGGVWSPTNYMVLKGLQRLGYDTLAYQIALNHLNNVVEVFESSDLIWESADYFRSFFSLPNFQADALHTLWENYAPEGAFPGEISKPGYVGWTGLTPIAILFEDIFGLKPEPLSSRLSWKIKVLEEHGVNQFPFGNVGLLDLKCNQRSSPDEKPYLEINSNVPITIEYVWGGGKDKITIR
jgi:hypothetical protein